LWHERFGHINASKTNDVLRGDYGSGLSDWNGEPMKVECTCCHMGKHTHSSHKGSSHPTSRPLELLVMDTCGPMPAQSSHGSTHFHLILDSHTCALDVAQLK
ncbi:hypothetical protein F5878DRAFT_504981, partial [Lentinula raphanica]